ncbi:ABC transporter permease [Bacillus cereus group sp. BfR-BA-01380]|uniref:ABC transporter permease n=1 Tax=Bacillus cereus group sp. BfR-BA-01380 TaxID=2920324 RepID=UPI001F567CA0|nr:ABC transporter permease [Bacillus cereus group sp. BfR-BA-01380]
MNFRQLAFNNVKGNWRNYKAFLISSCLSIFVFFMYASFIYHPDVVNGNISQKMHVEKGLEMCNYIVVLFSALFILYSNSIFLRARKKELGLLTLIGATKGQLGRMIMREQMILGCISIVSGIAFGMLGLPLFFKAVSVVVGIEKALPFVWNGKAIAITAGVYFILFFVLSLFGLWTIWRLQIIDLLRDARKQRVEPFSFTWLFLAGLLSIIVAYVLCFQVTLMNFFMYFLLIVGLTIIGTYFLFTQGSIVLLKALQKRKNVFYQHPNLFVISNLVYKMKDNARFLFVVSIITAVVASAMGTLYVFFEDMSAKGVEHTPHAISIQEKGVNSHEVVKEETMQSLLKKHNFEQARKVTVTEIPGTFHMKLMNEDREFNMRIISEKEFNAEAKKQQQDEIHNQPGTGTMVVLDMMNELMKFDATKTFTFKVQNQSYELKLNKPYTKAVFNVDNVFVVNEQDYAKYAAVVPDTEKMMYYGYYIQNWKDTEALVKELKGHIADDKKANFDNSILVYQNAKESGAITMFIGFFITILFFFFACSMTYFKWFNDKEQDRIQFHSLKRIGMTDQEIRKIAVRQMGAIFFIPILIGILHSGFALYTLGNMLYLDLWKSGAVIITAYVLASALYFAIAQRGYLKHVKS